MEQVSTNEIWDYNAGRARIFVVRGELDSHLSVELRDCLERGLTDSPDAVLVDLEEVTFMDASALGDLVTFFKKARAGGAAMRLVAPSVPVKRLLRLTQTDGVFPIARDLITAYARVAEQTGGPHEAAGCGDAA